ncbi:MmcB family DNA repair protein [Niallia sp. FSL R7-0648]|uniref:MmcB family DNA repair protein n=1 Tax=Niallia sp. FSL R7-0648 TaxID=2954521 RepID=UPI0030FCBAF7
MPNGKRADVVGYNENGHIMIIEVKVSRNDFQQDEKWTSYLDYCDEFYFLLNKEALPIYNQFPNKEVGLLQDLKNTLKIEKPHLLIHQAIDREKVMFSINKVLSKKFVYGY